MEDEKKQPGEELIDIDEKGNPIEKKEEKRKIIHQKNSI